MDLLLQLGEPAEGLCDDFLAHARTKLEEDLANLSHLAEGAVDPKQDETLPEYPDEQPETSTTAQEPLTDDTHDIKPEPASMVGHLIHGTFSLLFLNLKDGVYDNSYFHVSTFT